jgi:hypothetical protein
MYWVALSSGKQYGRKYYGVLTGKHAGPAKSAAIAMESVVGGGEKVLKIKGPFMSEREANRAAYKAGWFDKLG